jgi:hypothetical protein
MKNYINKYQEIRNELWHISEFMRILEKGYMSNVDTGTLWAITRMTKKSKIEGRNIKQLGGCMEIEKLTVDRAY